jgi:hypothetical protein
MFIRLQIFRNDMYKGLLAGNGNVKTLPQPSWEQVSQSSNPFLVLVANLPRYSPNFSEFQISSKRFSATLPMTTSPYMSAQQSTTSPFDLTTTIWKGRRQVLSIWQKNFPLLIWPPPVLPKTMAHVHEAYLGIFPIRFQLFKRSIIINR